MKRIMILGAGVFQVPLINTCRAMGFETLAVSRPGNYPGFQAADRAIRIDLREKERLLSVAIAHQVCAVVTDQTDIPVATAAWLAERLRLPGIGYERALLFTNKALMRKKCEEVGLPSMRWHVSNQVGALIAWAESSGYPVVVKPVDNQGSRGVTLAHDATQLRRAFHAALAHSACGEVIAEEWFEGREVVIQGFAQGGQFVNLIVGDRRCFNLPRLFIPQATLFPTTLPDTIQQRLLEHNTRLITGFGLPFGITHSEYLVEEQSGAIRLVEVAARGAGVFISSDVVPLASGVDVTERLVRCVTGQAPPPGPMTLRPAAAGYVCFALPEGVVTRAPNAQDVERIPGVHRVFLDDIQEGTVIGPLDDKTARKGPILIKGSRRKDLDEIYRQVQQTLHIEVETGTGTAGPIWD